MRHALVGALCGACVCVVVAALGWNVPSGANAQRSAGDWNTQDWVTHVSPIDENRQQIVVMDPRSRAVAVYHVSLSSGEIALKSVRNVHYDLQMTDFNSQKPLPQEIRGLLEQTSSR